MPEAQEDEIRTVTLSPWAGMRVAAVIGFAAGLTLVIVYLMTGGGQALLHRTVVVHTYMSDGTGLIRTADVELNGINVGKVGVVTLSRLPDAARAVRVDMKIRTNFLRAIPIDSKTEITANNLLGDKFINIRKGKSPQTIEAGAELGTEPPAANFDPGDLLASLSSILLRTNALLNQVEDPSTPIGNFVNGQDFYAKLLNDIVGLQTAIHKYDNPKSELGQAVYKQELYQQLRNQVLAIDRQIQTVQGNPMLASSTQYAGWVAQAKSFRQSVQAFREAPMMKQDELYNNMRDALKNLSETVNAMAAGRLLTSADLYESLNGSSRNARNFVREFRLNPQKYLRIKVF